MPVTITLAELAADLRLGDGSADPSAPIDGMLQRHLDTAAAIVGVYLPSDTPDSILNTAVIRVTGYLYDMPQAASGMRFAHIIVNSGAADVMRLFRPIDLHFDNARPDGGDVSIMPTPGNPVTSITVENGQLVIVYADGTTTRQDLPAGGGNLDWPGL